MEKKKSLKDYEKLKPLGGGGFGDVWLLRHKVTGEEYAARTINLTGGEDEDKILQEVRILQKLDHACIVKYLGHFNDKAEGKIVILLEYCPGMYQSSHSIGGNLCSFIRDCKAAKTPIPEDKVHKWLMQLCLGLQYIHSQKLVHRHIKPANILLDEKGNAKIADFGTVPILAHTSAVAPTRGGTAQYKSPEMCEGKPYGPAVDMWALGCVIQEMCTLEVFFVG